MKYAVVISKTATGYSAYAPDVLGCVAAADTFIETESLIREGIALHIEAMLEHGEAVPEPGMTIDDAIAYHSQEPSEEMKQVIAERGGFPPSLEVTFEMVDVEVSVPAAADG